MSSYNRKVFCHEAAIHESWEQGEGFCSFRMLDYKQSHLYFHLIKVRPLAVVTTGGLTVLFSFHSKIFFILN